MNSFFVIIQKRGKLEIPSIVNKAMEELRSEYSSYTDYFIRQNIGLGCHLSPVTLESNDELVSFIDKSSDCCVVANSRIDYRTELIEQLSLSIDELQKLPDSKLILFSYLKWGETCVEHLYGDFAFIIWDKSENKIFCARDHFGCRPLYYVDHEEYLALTTDIKAFNALPEFRYQINNQFVLDAICSIVPRDDVVTYMGVNRLEPAHTLSYLPEKTLKLKRYWDLRVQEELTRLSEKKAATGLKDLFIEAVRERSRSISPLGIELSGGLDSSSIASCVNQRINQRVPVYAFSHTLGNNQPVRPVPYNDEHYYSSKIVSFNKLNCHISVNGENEDGGFAAILNYLNIMMKPTVQSFAMMSDLLYEQANKAGIKVLLSGFGGDEGITYHGGELLEEIAAQKDYEKLKELLRDRIRNKGGNYYRKLIALYLKNWMPGLMFLLKKNWRRSRFRVFAYDEKLGLLFGMKNRYLNRVKMPDDPDVRKRQYKRIMYPHVADRLENSYFLAKAKGIEYRYPFLDVKLIEFFYSLPSEYKYKNGTGRYLFRMAMEGILPEEIRLREDKTGATIPNILYRIVKDERIFRELIEEGRMNNSFHYVSYDKLNWMLDQFKHEEKRKKMNFGPRAFLSPMSVLILQKWQREGKVDIGMKC